MTLARPSVGRSTGQTLPPLASFIPVPMVTAAQLLEANKSPTASAATTLVSDLPVSKEFLARYYHLPIAQAARELGVCTTMLKKMCRKSGVARWPFRKIHSIDRMIASLDRTLRLNPPDAPAVARELNALRARREQIISNPDADLPFPSILTPVTTTTSEQQQAVTSLHSAVFATHPTVAAASAVAASVMQQEQQQQQQQQQQSLTILSPLIPALLSGECGDGCRLPMSLPVTLENTLRPIFAFSADLKKE